MGVGSGSRLWNESMPVEDDGFASFLGSLGMMTGMIQNSGGKAGLAHEGVAEYFWSAPIRCFR
jgi:hypothetical protein